MDNQRDDQNLEAKIDEDSKKRLNSEFSSEESSITNLKSLMKLWRE